MESKSIKIVDNNGHDRVANVICSISLDGTDYIIYWIERDSEYNNIFVSKLIKDIDNTSVMLNLENQEEKSKVENVVKELVKVAVNNESSELGAESMVLSSGKKVNFIRSLIVKEQNINIDKTYIVSVKKPVTKVSEDFYKLPSAVVEEVSTVMPVNNTANENYDIFPSEPVVEEPVIMPITEPVVEPVTPVVSSLPQVEETKVEPVVVPSVEPVVNTASVLPVTPVVPNINEVKTESILETTNPNFESVTESVVSDLPESSVNNLEKPIENNLDDKVMLFDASKETNLNDALGEVSKDTSISVSSVEPIRDFGVDTSLDSQEKVEDVKVRKLQNPEVTSQFPKKAGFANNKFFMVVAIAFFLASCIFLGYEVFNYFKIK